MKKSYLAVAGAASVEAGAASVDVGAGAASVDVGAGAASVATGAAVAVSLDSVFASPELLQEAKAAIASTKKSFFMFFCFFDFV
jgi:hypothetical protein